MKEKYKKKEITILIIAIIFLLALIIGSAYAYFKAQIGTSKFFDIEVTTATTDNLTFSTVDEILLNISLETLKKEGKDVSDSSIAKARLIANNTTNYAERNYNVYFLIEENNIEYSSYTNGTDTKYFMTSAEKRKEDLEGYEGIPELVISVKKNGEEYTEKIDRLTKLNDGSYDITEEEGLYAIAENEKIVSTGDITDEWEVTVTYKNLSTNQQLNVGNSLTGKVIITPETLINKIQTINDLVDLSKEVNGGDTKEGKYYVLTKDLDFENINDYRDNREELKAQLTDPNGEGFIPIGNLTNFFQGNFDGGKHTLSNIYINNKTADKDLGLFGAIQNSKISNLTLTGEIKTSINANTGIIGASTGESIIRKCVNKSSISSLTSSYSLGGIIGGARSGTLTIQKCINYGSISGGNNTGGIIGLNSGSNTILTISNCHNYGTVTNNLGQHTGGILGRDNSASNVTTIINTVNQGEVLSESTKTSGNIYLGGLVGNVKGTLNIENSQNLKNNEETEMVLKIQGDTLPRIGGLIGYADGATIVVNNVVNEQNIKVLNEGTKENYLGGLVGHISMKSNLKINNSKNVGNLNHTQDGNGSLRIGGILGSIGGTSTIQINNSKNIGNIDLNINGTGESLIGGIIGYFANNSSGSINGSASMESKITITKNENNTNAHAIGGIIGYVSNNSIATITKSYNTTNVYDGTRFGGIVAYSNNAKVLIDKCYNTGSMETDFITNTAITIGGILGYNASGGIAYITNSYNTGNLKNTKDNDNAHMGGLIGLINSSNNVVNTYIANSYNIGNISTISGNNVYVNGIFKNNSSNNINNKGYINNVYNVGELVGPKKYGIGITNDGDIVNNAYYLEGEGITGSDKEGIGIPKTESEIKGLTDTLNNNIESISIPTLNTDFPEYNLTFSNWKVGSNGYPTLVNE